MKTIDILILLWLLSGLIIGFVLGNTHEKQSNIHMPIYENQQSNGLSPFYKAENIGTIRDPIQNTLHNALYSD